MKIALAFVAQSDVQRLTFDAPALGMECTFISNGFEFTLLFMIMRSRRAMPFVRPALRRSSDRGRSQLTRRRACGCAAQATRLIDASRRPGRAAQCAPTAHRLHSGLGANLESEWPDLVLNIKFSV